MLIGTFPDPNTLVAKMFFFVFNLFDGFYIYPLIFGIVIWLSLRGKKNDH